MHKNPQISSPLLLVLSIYLLGGCVHSPKVLVEQGVKLEQSGGKWVILPPVVTFPEKNDQFANAVSGGFTASGFLPNPIILEDLNGVFNELEIGDIAANWTMSALCGLENNPQNKISGSCNSKMNLAPLARQKEVLQQRLPDLLADNEVFNGYLISNFVEYLGPGDGPAAWKYRVHGAIINGQTKAIAATWSWQADTPTDSIQVAMVRIGQRVAEMITGNKVK